MGSNNESLDKNILCIWDILLHIWNPPFIGNTLPISSMYGTFTYIWLIFMLHVGKYTIHRSYGLNLLDFQFLKFQGCESQRKPIPFPGRFCHDVVGFSSCFWFGDSWPDPEIMGAYTLQKFTWNLKIVQFDKETQFQSSSCWVSK